MRQSFDSIYPDFLRTGLGKLNELGAHREILSLFSALENFRRDLHSQEDIPGVLQVTQRYIAQLTLFRTIGFYLVNPSDFGFELAYCAPEHDTPLLRKLVDEEIRGGRFAWALRQTSAVFFQTEVLRTPDRGIFHTMALSRQVIGMFCGVLHQALAPVQEIPFSVLSILLGASTDALSTMRKTAQLTYQIKTLSGLLPICAWCKKVRDDQGYWAQIEQYVQSRTDASFSHSICPDCQNKFLTQTKPG